VDLSPGLLYFWTKLNALLFSFGSHFSFTSLGAALVFASAFYTFKRLKRGRRLRWKTIWRALFPKRIVNNPSSYADPATCSSTCSCTASCSAGRS
jgi:hypothetical protein